MKRVPYSPVVAHPYRLQFSVGLQYHNVDAPQFHNGTLLKNHIAMVSPAQFVMCRGPLKTTDKLETGSAPI